MDDLKLYSSSRQHLNQLLTKAERFSLDIKMKFGLDKCRTNSMEKGKWIRDEGYTLEGPNIEEQIDGMEMEELYKYLGQEQSRG